MVLPVGGLVARHRPLFQLHSREKSVETRIMLDKCSNPSCSAPFRYLRNGRLFRLEGDPRLFKRDRLEYFWLCGGCSSKMSLRISDGGKVLPIMSRGPDRGPFDEKGITLVDRRDGLLLTRLGFLHEGSSTGAVFFGEA